MADLGKERGNMEREYKVQQFKGNEFKVIKGATHPDYSYATFEEEEKDFREQHWSIESGDVVFDIGSSYGSYALTACAMGATVFAFEPEKTIFRDLVYNITINGWLSKCFPMNLGMWSGVETVHMKEYAPHWPSQGISGSYSMDTIDNVATDIGLTKLDWIKMDIEGAEVNALKGGLNTIKKFHPKMIIECHNFLDKEITNKVKTLLLSAYNYEFQEIERDPCVMLLATPISKLKKISNQDESNMISIDFFGRTFKAGDWKLIPNNNGIDNPWNDENSIKKNHWNSLTKDQIVIDIGALFGLYTLPALMQGCKVFAFEPNIPYLHLMNEYVKMNKFTNYQGSHLAFWNNEPYPSALMDHWSQWSKQDAFKTITIDSFTKDFDRVDIIKMDVEGAEFGILEGAKETIKKFHPTFIIEDYTGVYEYCNINKTHDKIVLMLINYGYTVKDEMYLTYDIGGRNFIIAIFNK
jgi:FkbM family methyltransferase